MENAFGASFFVCENDKKEVFGGERIGGFAYRQQTQNNKTVKRKENYHYMEFKKMSMTN